MCVEPQTAVSAAQNGLLTWFHQILPALLPFTILSAIFLRSGCMDNPGAHANLYAIIITLSCGFLFGFPIGAKLASDFYEKQLLTRKQALLLCISANNFSIAYVGGFVLPFLFAEQQLEKCTYMMLYLIPLTITLLLFLLPVFRPKKNFHPYFVRF